MWRLAAVMALCRALVVVVAVSVGLVMASSALARPLVWERSGGPTGGAINAIVVDSSSAGVVYAGGLGGVFKSVDGGSGWVRSGEGVEGVEVLSLAVDSTRPGTVYAGTLFDDVFKSVDGGSSWVQTFQPSRFDSEALAVDGANETVFVGSDEGLFV